MRIIHKIGIGLLAIAMAVALPLAAGRPLGLAAADGQGHDRFWAFSISGGCFRPSQSIFRQLYAPLLWPVTVQIHFQPLARLGAFLGWRYLAAEGQTTVLEPEFEEAGHAIRLRLHSFRLGMTLHLPWRRIIPFLGIGACYHLYQERWLEAPIKSTADQFGLLALAGVAVPLNRRWSIEGHLEYAYVPVSQNTPLDGVDLGGIDLRLGLAFHL